MKATPPYCRICQSPQTRFWAKATDYEYSSTAEEFDFYICDDCDTLFIEHMPLDRLGQIYPPNYYSFHSKRASLVFRIKEWLDLRYFRNVLQKINANEIQVLDVGGGSGWLLDSLRRIDKRVRFTQVVDIDEHAGEIARSNGHAYHQGTIESFDTERRFHLVLMLNLIEHVADPQAVLEKTAGLLDPEGCVIVKTPNHHSWDARLFRKSYWGGLHGPRHWHIFSQRSWGLLVSRTNLETSRLQLTQGAPFWAFSIIASWHRKGWLRVSAERPIIFHPLFAPISASFAIFDWIRKPFAKTSQMFIQLRMKK